jgi:ISXO2-like transposase domain/Transposase zinc-ribbon domain
MKTPKTPTTLLEAVRYFADPDTCLEYMVASRWPNGVACPTCGSMDVSFLKTRKIWKCKSVHPKQQFSAKVGTIFEDSPIPLDKWLATMWLIANAKNGVSSYEIHRSIGVTQKTAWFMLHRIRLAMQSDDDGKMDGEVEVDETFVGGVARNMHKDRRKRLYGTNVKGTGVLGKTAVFGLLERHGPDGHSRVRARVMKGTRRVDLIPEISANVEKGSEVYSDAYRSYIKVREDYTHKFIDHAERYVDGKVHTNGIENFWSLLKRAIKGTYVNVEPFHLKRYVDEQVFRFNSRKHVDGERFNMAASGIVGKRLMYKDLIGAATRPA